MTEQSKRKMADNIRWAMKEKKMTVGKLAKESDISTGTIFSILSANWDNVTTKTLESIGKPLDLPLDITLG
jgi:DNA-binding Xre family transcriptional regulator